MWNFVKHELSSAGLNILYPESVVSCPILLMNGRINTRILANALPYQISKTDWELIFNKLYPLIIPADAPDEFTLFHNDPCFGNYGLLAHEGALVEFGGDFAHINGASLFKVVGGNMFFYLCNSQIAPSEIWREGFKCVPDHTSPYCWRDENGNIVLRFERIASPIREAMHEKYYRQPILFRWLCNSEWLKETLCKHNLHLRYVSRLESIP